jgi:hypothetical protein
VVFKEKEPFENKSLVDWQEEERLQHSFEKPSRTYNKRSHLELIYKLWLNLISPRISI